jgi:lipopolysaccharide export system permease protein
MNETLVTVGKRCVMQASPDNMYLKITLYDGYTYIESSSGDNYRSRPLTSIGFNEQSLNFDISSFAYNKSVEENFKGSYQMMNISQLDTSISQLEQSYVERVEQYRTNMLVNLRAWSQYTSSDSTLHTAEPTDPLKLISNLFARERRSAYLHARNAAISARQDAEMYEELLVSDREYINRH